MFRIRDLFFRIRIELFFLSPDWIGQKSGSGKIRIRIRGKNVQKLQVETFSLFILSTLKHCPFWSGSSKTLSNHHLDPIKVKGSGSGLLKPGSRSAIKTRIHPDPKHFKYYNPK